MRYIFYVLIVFFPILGFAQTPTLSKQPRTLSLEWADTLHKKRLRSSAVFVGVAYPTAMIGLWNSWYKDYPIGRFHLFNDNKEWNQMDKIGHVFSAYHENRLGYHLGRWSGMSNNKATWTGVGLAQLVQTSFEIFDGFSTEWGFSMGDMGANILGSTLFTAQQIAWKEQRITLKMSTAPDKYPNTALLPYQGVGAAITLQQRSDELYGTGLASAFLKNYNALTIWTSVNPRSFAPQATWIPKWLNIAVGMGSDNMFAGFGYDWQVDKSCTGPDCLAYRVDQQLYPRSRQWYLSLDIDMTRIKVKNRVLRTVLHTFGVFKIPAPTLEWHQQRGLQFHPIYF